MTPLSFPTLALITRNGALEEVLTHGKVRVTSINYDVGGQSDQPIRITDGLGQQAAAVVRTDIQSSNTDRVSLLAAVLPPLGRPVFQDLTEIVQAFVLIRDGAVQTVLTDEPIGLIEVNREPKDVAPQDQSQTIDLGGGAPRALADWGSVEVDVKAVDRLIGSIEAAVAANTQGSATKRSSGPR